MSRSGKSLEEKKIEKYCESCRYYLGSHQCTFFDALSIEKITACKNMGYKVGKRYTFGRRKLPHYPPCP